MDWLNRYHLRKFFRSSFWVMPTAALLLAIVVARFLRWMDEFHSMRFLGLTPEGAKAVLSAFVSSMLTFVVVVASSLLLVVQMVSASLTPRIIAPAFEHPLIRLSLSVFIFAYTLSVAVLARITDQVPQFAVAITIICNIVSLILFMHFVGSLGMGLRPIQMMAASTKKGRTVIYDIYPRPYDANHAGEELHVARNLGMVRRELQYEGSSRVLLAFDSAGLVSLAQKHEAVIELVPMVGDPVAVGEPLFRMYGSDSIDPRQLRRMVALGPERTLEQDPRLAFRIILDIACKALSPAINDPTTAVLAIDQIHRLFRWVGGRQLLSGALKDSTGSVRLVFPTPSWEDFVWLGTAELRQYGADSIRVCQRMHAMFEHLIQNLPQARRSVLERHLRLLDQTVERKFCEPEDRERIRTGTLGRNGSSADA
ncbi:MAG TPA: DUF2254 domain-containing protein [Tepidisphaeraceae bacterium]|nr:DUF2254 domain-containing protein [Tepidisphaeraceae bacterium]